MYIRRRWTKEEIEYLKENYPKLPTFEIAKKLQKPINAIIKKAYKLGIKKKPEVIRRTISLSHKKYRYWSEEELEYLRKNYTQKPIEELSKKLGRSIQAIRSKASFLGLRRSYSTSDRWLILKNATPIELSDKDKGWLAGIIDGEGSLTVHCNGRSPRLIIANTDPRIIERIKQIIGNLGYINIVSRKPKRRTKYVFIITNPVNLYRLLKSLKDHLCKKKEAELLIRLIEIRSNASSPKLSEEEKNIIKQLREIHCKGVSVDPS